MTEQEIAEAIDNGIELIKQQSARIKELEEALQFYADEDNHKSTEIYNPCVMGYDTGRRARQALKGGEG